MTNAIDELSPEEILTFCRDGGLEGVCILRRGKILVDLLPRPLSFDRIGWETVAQVLAVDPASGGLARYREFHLRGCRFLACLANGRLLMLFPVPREVEPSDLDALVQRIEGRIRSSQQTGRDRDRGAVIPSPMRRPGLQRNPLLSSRNQRRRRTDTVAVSLHSSAEVPAISFRTEEGLRQMTGTVGVKIEDLFPGEGGSTVPPSALSSGASDGARIEVSILHGLLSKFCSDGHAKRLVSREARKAGLSSDDRVDQATFLTLAENIIRSVPDNSKQELLKTDLHEILPA